MADMIRDLPYWFNCLVVVTLFVLGSMILMQGISEEAQRHG
jgi:uncharacterized protein (DUF983 family)